ncbi:MAG: hypothetical protein ACLP1X_12115 [Polyangiaceae bacterium]
MGTHDHLSCIVCGSRLPKGWLTRARGRPRRWAYRLESFGWGRVRKVGEFHVEITPPKDARKWWGQDAVELAELVFVTAAQLMKAGWPCRNLMSTAEALERERAYVATCDAFQRQLAVSDALVAQYAEQARLLPGRIGDGQGGTTTRDYTGRGVGGTTIQTRLEDL